MVDFNTLLNLILDKSGKDLTKINSCLLNPLDNTKLDFKKILLNLLPETTISTNLLSREDRNVENLLSLESTKKSNFKSFLDSVNVSLAGFTKLKLSSTEINFLRNYFHKNQIDFILVPLKENFFKNIQISPQNERLFVFISREFIDKLPDPETLISNGKQVTISRFNKLTSTEHKTVKNNSQNTVITSPVLLLNKNFFYGSNIQKDLSGKDLNTNTGSGLQSDKTLTKQKTAIDPLSRNENGILKKLSVKDIPNHVPLKGIEKLVSEKHLQDKPISNNGQKSSVLQAVPVNSDLLSGDEIERKIDLSEGKTVNSAISGMSSLRGTEASKMMEASEGSSNSTFMTDKVSSVFENDGDSNSLLSDNNSISEKIAPIKYPLKSPKGHQKLPEIDLHSKNGDVRKIELKTFSHPGFSLMSKKDNMQDEIRTGITQSVSTDRIKTDISDLIFEKMGGEFPAVDNRSNLNSEIDVILAKLSNTNPALQSQVLQSAQTNHHFRRETASSLNLSPGTGYRLWRKVLDRTDLDWNNLISGRKPSGSTKEVIFQQYSYSDAELQNIRPVQSRENSTDSSRRKIYNIERKSDLDIDVTQKVTEEKTGKRVTADFKLTQRESSIPDFRPLAGIEHGKAEFSPDRVTLTNLPERILQKLNVMVQNRNHSARIELNPPNLGTVKLFLHFNGGELTIRLIVESEKVRKIIENNIQRVENVLNNHDLKLKHFTVIQSNSDNNTQQQQSFSGYGSFSDENNNQDSHKEFAREKEVNVVANGEEDQSSTSFLNFLENLIPRA